MSDTIVTKFALATDQGIRTVLAIGEGAAREKYAGKIPGDKLEVFIQNNFNYTILHAALNSLLSQYFVVYLNGEVAGYARTTSKDHRPVVFGKKTVVRIADFYVLKRFNNAETKKSLFEKCLSVCSMQQIIWIAEFEGNADLAFFESYGFRITTAITGSYEFNLEPVYLVREKIRQCS